MSQIVDTTCRETLTFTYDELDWLDIVSEPFSHTYDYNTIGNITSKNTTSYMYGNSAHKHAVTALSTGETCGYDANGNTLVPAMVLYCRYFIFRPTSIWSADCI